MSKFRELLNRSKKVLGRSLTGSKSVLGDPVAEDRFNKETLPELVKAIHDVTITAAVEEEALRKLIRTLNSEDRSEQITAAKAIGKIGSKAESAIPELILMLYWDMNEKQRAAIEALGNIGEKPEVVVPELMKFLDFQGGLYPEKSGERAIISIAKFGDYACPLLLEALKGKNYKLRETVFSKLNKKVAQVLFNVLEFLSNDALLRKNAAKTLGRIGDPSVIPTLKKVVEIGNDIYVIEATQDAIANIESKSSGGQIKTPQEDPK